MALQSLSQAGKGGSGIPDQIPAALKELQGLTVTLVDGATSGTKINVAAMRSEDTILSIIEHIAGVPTNDRASIATIADVRASGTLTVGSPSAGATFVVGGITYTLRASADPLLNEVTIGANAAGTAANIAAKVNQNDPTRIIATSNSNVVTFRAVAEGTGPNAYTLVGSTGLTASGATLSGGTTTGGFSLSSSTASNKLVVTWFNKR